MWRWGLTSRFTRTQSIFQWATRCGGPGPAAATASPAALLARPIHNFVRLTTRCAFRECSPMQVRSICIPSRTLAVTRITASHTVVLGMTGAVNVTGGCAPSGWSAVSALPTPGVRLAGVYFQPNGKFYAMGGRASDTAGNEFTHPFEYDPNTNTWTTKAATYPDNHGNNMACGVLSDAGNAVHLLRGRLGSHRDHGHADRVFRYDPVTDTISRGCRSLAGCLGQLFCLAASPCSKQAVHPRRIRHHHGRRARDKPDLGVYSVAGGLGAEAHCSACSAGLHTHHDHRQPHLHGWGKRYSRLGCLPIRPTPLFITRWRIRSARLPPYRERQERRGRLTSTAKC